VTEYSFVTRWSFKAPIERIWERIADAERWPEWWTYVKKVEALDLGAADGKGRVLRMTWRTRLPYSLTFDIKTVRIDPPCYMEGQAQGELVGSGIWRLRQVGDDTDVRYDWDVRTTKFWMNALAPIARPIFSWNHAGVMNAGEDGLRKLVEI
jgi:hypothetical protein